MIGVVEIDLGANEPEIVAGGHDHDDALGTPPDGAPAPGGCPSCSGTKWAILGGLAAMTALAAWLVWRET